MGGFWPILCFGGGLLGPMLFSAAKVMKIKSAGTFKMLPRTAPPVLLLFPMTNDF